MRLIFWENTQKYSGMKILEDDIFSLQDQKKLNTLTT